MRQNIVHAPMQLHAKFIKIKKKEVITFDKNTHSLSACAKKLRIKNILKFQTFNKISFVT